MKETEEEEFGGMRDLLLDNKTRGNEFKEIE